MPVDPHTGERRPFGRDLMSNYARGKNLPTPLYLDTASAVGRGDRDSEARHQEQNPDSVIRRIRVFIHILLVTISRHSNATNFLPQIPRKYLISCNYAPTDVSSILSRSTMITLSNLLELKK
jgi:hypothetical protein